MFQDHKEFDKQFKTTNRMISFVWVAMIVVNVVLLAVGVWAVVELVGWVKTK